MHGDDAQTVDASALHRYARIQALRHGAGDESSPLFLERLDQWLLLRDERVEPRRLTSNPIDDGVLLRSRGDGTHKLANIGHVDRLMRRTHDESLELGAHGSECVKQEFRAQVGTTNPVDEVLRRRHVGAHDGGEPDGGCTRKHHRPRRQQPRHRIHEANLADLLVGFKHCLYAIIAELPHVG